ncbi:MAG: M4 family metallopeptidase, partial [Calditrichaeota bacterium]|nr:M4 family metallopeptidase [Calditrichota bacterium]
MMRRQFGLAFLLIAVLPSLLLAQKTAGKGNESLLKGRLRMQRESALPVRLELSAGNGVEASRFFPAFKKTFSLAETADFRVIRESGDPDRGKLTRYEQLYSGIPVEGAFYVLHQSGDQVFKANGFLVKNPGENPRPEIDSTTALQLAIAHIGARRYMWENPENEAMLRRESGSGASFYPAGHLIWSRIESTREGADYRLAYRFDIYAEEPLGRFYVDVDARNGTILKKIARLVESDFPGTGESLYQGTVSLTVDEAGGQFRLRESARDGLQTYDMGNGTDFGAAVDIVDADGFFSDSRARAAVDAHWGAEKTYDYFHNEFGRQSYDDRGSPILSYVHYSTRYNNASWDGTRMRYGDGDGTRYGPLTSIDVVAHEITHGVTEHAANLVYQNEPGALSESFSDIFGTVIEFYAEGADSGNWLIGEDFDLAEGNGFRSMSDPKAQGDPDTYFGTNWVPLSSNPGFFNDYGGVHANSGVQNYWFYLLCEGGTGVNDNGTSYAVAGIGISKAARIAYRNLTVYLGPHSGYPDARNGSIDAAADLFGGTSPEVQAVRDAWDAVGVSEPPLPEGVLVFEGKLDGENYSGQFIAGYLESRHYPVHHTTRFPPSLIGYDAVFLSFGNYGNGGGTRTEFDAAMAAEVEVYLQSGGKVYLDGGDALGWDQRSNNTLYNLLGLAAVSDGTNGSTPVSELTGQPGSLAAGMRFTGSSQTFSTYIDIYRAGGGTPLFTENSAGEVAVQNAGENGAQSVVFSYALGALADNGGISTRAYLVEQILTFFGLQPPRVVVAPHAWLEGPFSGGAMRTDLSDQEILPLYQPYDAAPWLYPGGESVAEIPPNTVDWVLLKLRSDTPAASEVAVRAAFLLADGSIVDLDGSSPVVFEGVPPGSYFLVLCHRNHLDVMSALPLALGPVALACDLTASQAACYGQQPLRDLGGGFWGLYAGDGNGDGVIDVRDRDGVWRVQNG